MVCRKRVEPDFEGFKVPDASPHFAFPLRDRFIQEGIGFKLLASVEAKPPPTVNRPFINSHTYSPSVRPLCGCVLILPCM